MQKRTKDCTPFLLGIGAILIAVQGISGQVNLIPEDSKFTPDARVEFTKAADPQLRKAYSTGTIKGIPYLLYLKDGTGEIEGQKGKGVDGTINPHDVKTWTLRCSRSPVNNQKHCGVGKAELLVANVLLNDGTSLYWVATLVTSDGGTLPIAISVDDGPVYVLTDSKGQISNTVIDEMKTGMNVTVRRRDSAGGPDIVNTFDLHGFKEALSLCEWAVRQIK